MIKAIEILDTKLFDISGDIADINDQLEKLEAYGREGGHMWCKLFSERKGLEAEYAEISEGLDLLETVMQERADNEEN